MGDSHQENDKRKGKVVEKYKVWTSEESNELLKLMVDAATHGWRDSNGLLSKITVERKILPALNEKLGCQKTYPQYLSRLKWFKQRYNNFSQLMRHSSGFGWDPITKKFTASDEVWEDYLKSHPTHKNYRTDTFVDYEDMRIAIGNGTAVGKHSIGLGDGTDARTFGVEENREGGLDDLIYDLGTGTFVTDQQESLSPRNSTSPLPSQPMSSEVPPATRKRNRTEYEGKSSSFETNNTQPDAIDKLVHTIDKLNHTIDSIATREHSSWDLIKEIPNLDNCARFKALKLLNTRAKKIEFSKMTPEERSEWIFYELTE
ncbi:hypothetical protein LWI29_003276 [Acer saccharum]|uniref:Myb/SANT-like domain-containing protein n=1 Tax=Acer saccharum TaxID=4024 RepID=A0AA39RG21_ACESA|nr:hypothetical protein LWI29_003276 [Acer saccharum]